MNEKMTIELKAVPTTSITFKVVPTSVIFTVPTKSVRMVIND